MSNRLANERSPYLLQHAENPVDWYPWGPEAFEKARREDKPVFLSIGYATCHWCHVMARESFENEAVAAVLNRDYVPVKVDREERPDVDSVYMEVCTAANGSGGWPLTVIMTPAQQPFFVGTYLPRENRGGRVGLLPLLRALADRWRSDRASLLKTGAEITAWLRQKDAAAGSGSADESFLKKACEQLCASYDKEYGGFGTAPKFPAPQNLLFLLRQAAFSGDKSLRQMAEFTLQQMFRGGIYDHLGGGFCRYSTDREWLAPHFEKTLYDNALLAFCYTEAWQDGHYALWRSVAESTLDYCLRELKDEAGGFCSGQDADSEDEEGKYYLFTPGEVREALGEEHGKRICECYDITGEGNFHGKSIPNLLINQRWNLIPEGYEDDVERLRLWRQERCRPRADTKLLSGWNGLMLTALARAARVFDDPRYGAAAQELADFLLHTAGAESPADFAAVCYGGERAPLPAQLDDCVFTALGLLELYRLDFDARHILQAAKLAAFVASHFADGRGGFYRTSDTSETLLKRPRELFDGALPSGNSGAAVLFAELGRMTGDAKWAERADTLLDLLCARAERWPAGIVFALTALQARVYPTRELVCVSEGLTPMLRAALSRYAPELTVLLKRPGDEALAEAAEFTAAMAQQEGKPTWYLCQNGVCGLPFTES